MAGPKVSVSPQCSGEATAAGPRATSTSHGQSSERLRFTRRVSQRLFSVHPPAALPFPDQQASRKACDWGVTDSNYESIVIQDNAIHS